MKKIEAIFRPEKLDDVKDSLKAVGQYGMTILRVDGSGQSEPQEVINRGQRFTVDLTKKVKLETIVEDNKEEEVIKAILASARTGDQGDGIISVIPFDTVYNITKGELGL